MSSPALEAQTDLSRLSVVELIDHLQRRDVRLWAEAGKLRFSAPKGGLAPELRAALVARKPELLAFLERAAATPDASPPLERAPRDRPLPLSFAQERLFFFDRMQPGSSAYNLFQAVRLGGALSHAALAAALDEIRRRHEILRTTFREGEDGVAVQLVGEWAPRALPLVDLSALPSAARRSLGDELARAERGAPFDLGRGPLLRTWTARLAADEHLLFVTQHHIVSDGSSTAIFIRELLALYPALVAAGADREAARRVLPEPRAHYADYALWQRRVLADGGELERQLEYWTARLAGAPEQLELPADRPRAPGRERRGATLRRPLPRALTQAVEALAARRGATPFMLLLAAAQLLLGRWSDRSDVVVGTPVANRHRAETEGMIGFFVNTLALRTRMAPGESFAALLERVREQTIADLAHQDLPFERLVEALAPRRSTTHTPLVQAFFALQNAPQPRLALGDLEMRPLPAPPGAEIFELELNLGRDEDGALVAGWRYATALFDRSTVARLADRFVALLAAAVEDPERRLVELARLPAAERHQLRLEHGFAPSPAAAPLALDRLAAAARRAPDAAALSTPGERGEGWSHGRLARAAERLARRLAALGARRGEAVAICGERSPRLVAALVAAWRAGAMGVPLDPAQPAQRLELILGDCFAGREAPLLLLDGELPAGAAPPPGTRVVDLAAALADESAVEAPLPPPPGAADPAYAIYTSGTTGRPKAVTVTHGNLAQTLAATGELFAFDADDRGAVLASFAFDIFLFELLGPLAAGGEAVLFSRAQLLDGEALLAELPRLTRLHAVPALMAQLAARVESSGAQAPRLRTLFVGGDRVPPGLLVEMRRVFGAAVGLYVLYGPTEATILASAHAVGASGAVPGAMLGRPLPGVRLALLDSWGNEAPLGAAGEVLIAGPGVSGGYRGRPALTAELFVPDAGGEPGARAYRSGDLARRRAGGALEFLGRRDHQLKVRGVRIEPGEVQAALEAADDVAEALVTARDDGPGGPRLVAYVVPAAGAAPSVDELAARARQALPEAMVPSAFVLLAALPLTANAKVDRAALPAPEAPAGEAVAPRSAAERRVAELFAEVLELETVGATDDFFALGGHSLLAARLAARLRDAFPGAAGGSAVRLVFEHPTVERLAAALQAAASAGSLVAAPPASEPVLPAPRDGALPLSFAQQRLWFLDRLEPGSAAYNMPLAMRLDGRLEPALLARVLAEVVRRHEALRTTFRQRGDAAEQVIAAPAPRPLPAVDLGALPAPAARRESERLAAADARRPFDLERGPLLRTALLRLGERRHRLLLAMHHIVSDGWSMGVLMREVGALYRAFAAGRPSPLPELEVHYADYALWQRRRLGGERLEEEVETWRRRLDGVPQVLELPYDRPRPARPEHRAAVVPLALDAPRSEAVEGLAARLGATPFMLLLAAFQGLLGRWSGQRRLIVGVPTAGRPRPELEPLIGFFINTLPLAGDLRRDAAGEPSFERLVERARDAALEAFAHGEVPFERLVEELAPAREGGVPPLFQVVFVLQNAPGGRLELPELALELETPAARRAKFDLTLSLARQEGGFAGSLELDRDLFDRSTGVRLARELEALLAAAIEAPHAPLAELDPMPAAERHQLLVEWRGATSGYPRAATLPELVARAAARDPEAPALVPADGEAAWSYRRLLTAARRMARAMRRAGVRRGDRVALLLEREPRLVAGLLATLEAGAAYVPLDPSHPPARQAALLADSGAALLVTAAGLEAGLDAELAALTGGPRALPPVLDLDAEERAITALSDAPLGLALDPLDLAYVLYTSGSTGRPKGVAVPHRAVARLVLDSGWAELSADQTLLLLAPLAFDASTLELWGALLTGARLVIYPERTPSIDRLASVLAEHRVSFLWLTAGLFHLMVEERLEALAGVGQVLSGGDVVSPEHARRLLAAPGKRRLIDGYGPTENTTFTTCQPLTDAARVPAPIPIGRPIEDGEVLILDRRLRPVPRGVAGELCAGGDGLARGYLGDPRRTAEVFVPHPLPPSGGERLYRTGDRARWRADGSIDFLGRFDFQVKIRGFRIEPGEVEAVLAAHPAVSRAVVLARDGAGGKRLLAWAVPAEGRAAEQELGAELRAHLERELPAHMVPDAVIVLAELPLTANAKLDRAALPEPDARPSGEAPRSAAERLVARLWCELLELPEVGRDDDFFALGGHSLLATRLVARLRDAAGVELALREVFDHPVLERLAQRVEGARAGAGEALLPALGDAPRPLSFAQQRLWFLDRLEGSSAAYNMPTALELRGALAPAALSAAIAAVVRRHESLRTRFAEGGEEPVQLVEPPRDRALPAVDLSGLAAGAAEAEALRLGAADAARPFDLARGPLLRVALLRLAPRRHLLLSSFHHAISDGWSMGVYVREVSRFYRAAVAAPAAPSPAALAALEPPLPVQYGDYALWQRRRLGPERIADEIEHWRRALAGAPQRIDLPTDRPRPAVQSYRGASVAVALGAATARRLEALAGERGATLFMALLAGFATLLGRHAGQRDLLLGTPVAGRTESELEGLIGFFVNTLVLRLELEPEAGFAAALDATRRRALDAFAHQELPFERLVEELAPQRDLSAQPLFQVMLSLQNTPSSKLELPGLTLEPRVTGAAAAKFDLSLALAASAGGGLAGGLEYAADLFDRSTALRLARQLERLLAAAAARPETPLAELPVLSSAERHQLLVELTGAPGRTPVAELPTLAERFVAQAARTPDAVAVARGGRELSYAELELASRRLAARLRAAGAGRETTVAVCLYRTAELVAAILGVLRAGAAYVPLDPAYPRQRVELMLEDSGARLALAHAELEPLVAGEERRVLVVDETIFDAEAPGEGSDPALDPALDARPENLAYFIYTSGSTGRPKGVAIEHRSASRMVEWGLERFAAEVTAGTLAATSVCFDLSVFELFVPLSRGSTLVLVDDALALLSLPAAESERVTLVNTVPSAMATLLREEALPPSTRVVNLAGEPLPRALADAVYARPGVEALFDLYGPSEDTTYSTEERVERVAATPPRIGRPLVGTRGYVLDRALRPVPRGARGELFLAGDGLARQYFRRPARTAESFRPDPWADTPGARMYGTGDLVRVLADGRLDYQGRRDHQVKLRGFRIELGEIETVLERHPRVAAAAVLVRGADDRATLVAYLEPRGGDELDLDSLRAWLGAELPAHMVPAVIRELAEMPLSPNGKIDRKALAALTPDAAGAGERRPPATAAEATVAQIWRELLGVDEVGRDDSFFALGGHSLLATRLVSRLRETAGVELPLRAVFDHPTLAALAAAVEASGGGAVEAIPRLPRDRPLPLSFAQQRLWFLDRLEGAGAAYNMPLALALDGELEVAALAAALAAVVRRHESLRTVFVELDGEPRQHVLAPSPPPLPAIDLGRLERADADSEARRLGAVEARRSFDLERGPLLRTALLRLAPRRHRLLVSQHHIVSDGWSIGRFVAEVAALYREAVGAESAPGAAELAARLPELPVQYADYAAWQRRRLDGETLEAEVEHWRRELDGAPQQLSLPADRRRPPAQSYRGAALPLALPAALVERLEAIAREQRGTLFMVLLAGFAALLARLAGQRDLLLGSPVAGRTRAELEPLIGFFVNTLVLRIDLGPGAPSLRDALEQARRRTLAAYAHQEVPFERLVEALAERRDLALPPLFQVMLVLGNTPQQAIDLPGLAATPASAAAGTAKVDLTLTLSPAARGLEGALEYSTDLFDATTIERLGRHLAALLEAAAEAPGAPLFELSWLDAAERHQLLVEWGDGGARAVLDEHGAAQPIGAPGRLAGGARLRRLRDGGLERLAADPQAAEHAPLVPAPRRAEGDAGRDAIERRVVELFAELLAVEADSATHFFAAGGHSLLAVRLASRLHRELGIRLPVASLFSHPTPRSLAVLLRARRDAPAAAASGEPVELRPGGEHRLLLVHPIGGGVLCYAPLAGRLDPALGLVAQPAPDALPATLEELAARYVAALGARPEVAADGLGGWTLGGWSMGGVIAFEMARQLAAAGVEIAGLLLVDSQPPPLPAADEHELLGRFALDLLASQPAPPPPAALTGLDPRAGLEALWRRARARRLLPPELDLAEIEALWSRFRALHALLDGYNPRPHAGRATLLRAADGPVDAAAWRALAPELELVELPGDHHSLVLGSELGELAAAIERSLGVAAAVEER